MIQIYYRDGFRRNHACLFEEDYFYLMKSYGFDPEKDGHKTTKDGKEIEYFIPKTETSILEDDGKICRIKEIIVDKKYSLGYKDQ